MTDLEPILSIALDLSASLGSADRYRRLLEAVRQAIPCDASALLRVEGDVLVPIAAHGLTPDAMGRSYPRADHPRLDVICSADAPVLFPPDSPLPDPFDGMLARDASALRHVHACLGCPLRVEGELVGALTADALDPDAFAGLDLRLLAFLGALAGAAMRTSSLIEALENAAAHEGLVARELVRDAQEREGQLIGTSEAMMRLRREMELVASSQLTVLILGETGVGKELVARGIHAASHLRDKPLIHVNCAALPESVAESELFGHVRGAFTGATSDRAGKFEIARGGTLFLDEVGELPLSVQPKLLRALQDGEIQRVGSDRTLRVSTRVLAATNRDLESEVAAGRFRADLYHRLAVYPIRVAPLRERREDIPILAGYFCDLARRRLGVGPVRLTRAAHLALARYAWPGNVRELSNVLSRVVLRASATVRRGEPIVIDAPALGPELAELGTGDVPTTADGVALAAAATVEPGMSLREAVAEFQREMIRRALAASGGNWAAAARRLRMDRGNLHNLARRLGLR
ncbi:MAG TPA: nitric oxide reductase transcriptional regulator NorR [Candidatus Binatia bacterium]